MGRRGNRRARAGGGWVETDVLTILSVNHTAAGSIMVVDTLQLYDVKALAAQSVKYVPCLQFAQVNPVIDGLALHRCDQNAQLSTGTAGTHTMQVSRQALELNGYLLEGDYGAWAGFASMGLPADAVITHCQAGVWYRAFQQIVTSDGTITGITETGGPIAIPGACASSGVGNMLPPIVSLVGYDTCQYTPTDNTYKCNGILGCDAIMSVEFVPLTDKKFEGVVLGQLADLAA